MSWIENRDVSTIQSAIQSQTVQTAIDSNTSKITDTGFQSFLQNAPIPRLLLIQSAAQTVATLTTTTITWNQAGRVHDPYQMLSSGSTSTIIIPISGYYSFVATAAFNVVGNYSGRFLTYTTGVSKRLGSAATIMQFFAGDGAGESGNNGNIVGPIIVPFDAGDSFIVTTSHNGGAGISTAPTLTTLGGVWCAPYNQYTTGSGGN